MPFEYVKWKVKFIYGSKLEQIPLLGFVWFDSEETYVCDEILKRNL